MGADGAGVGVGREQRAHDCGGAEGQRLGAEWQQDLHHERALCRCGCGDCGDGHEKGTHGLSAFMVEKGTKGFRPGKKENKLGLRASDTSELIFEDCEIPEENLLGAEGEGFVDAMRVLDGGRISIAAMALGMARGALEASLKYVKERRQFGKAIAEFQGDSMEAGRYGDGAGRGAVADASGGGAEGCRIEDDAASRRWRSCRRARLR